MYLIDDPNVIFVCNSIFCDFKVGLVVTIDQNND